MAGFIDQFVNSKSRTLAGLTAVKRAEEAGMSLADIEAAAKNEGFEFRPAARQYLDVAAPVERLKISLQDQFERQRESFNQGIQEQQQQFDKQREMFQQQLAERQQQAEKQQQLFRQQLAERQQQAEMAQRQLMIGLQQREKQPTEVRMATSGADKQGFIRRGTTGYFGRKGMRIGSLNVPNTGMALSPNSRQSNMTGTFA